jgi:hypothetical protein
MILEDKCVFLVYDCFLHKNNGPCWLFINQVGSNDLYRAKAAQPMLPLGFESMHNHGPHPGGVSVTSSFEKNPLRQSQGRHSPACSAKWSLHFVHNLCLVQKESPFPRNRPICHAVMDIVRDSLQFRPFIQNFSFILIQLIQNCVGVVPSPSSHCFSSVNQTRTLCFFPNSVWAHCTRHQSSNLRSLDQTFTLFNLNPTYWATQCCYAEWGPCKFAMQVWTLLVFRPFIPKFSLFLTLFTQNCVGVVL